MHHWQTSWASANCPAVQLRLQPRNSHSGALLCLLCLLCLLLCSLTLGCKTTSGAEVTVTIGAASSMRVVMPALVKAFEASSPGTKVRVAYGASGDLRKRVIDGAPIDAVVLADAATVESLLRAGQVVADPRKTIATNALVLVGASPLSHKKLRFASIEQLPAGEKLAIGNPDVAPVGRYARSSLKRLGKWKALQGRLIFGGNVAAVLTYARRGEAAAAIVYETDSRGVKDVVLLDRAKGTWAASPQVVVSLLRAAEHPVEARAFLEFLGSKQAQRILKERGFGSPQ